MLIKNILVTYRKSLYQIYVTEHKERSIRRALRKKDAVALALKRTHEINMAALADVKRTLRSKKIDFVARWRAHVRATKNYDLVISLGGDGTLLDTSRRIQSSTPLLGINSDPDKSMGALCSGTAQDLSQLLDDLISGSLRPRSITRIRTRLDGEEIVGPTLNDLLFSHVCPAGLTRFDMAIVPTEEANQWHSGHNDRAFDHYRGSGLWISTATGSTAAIHSAGGKIMPLGSRRLQYLVREPYIMPAHRHRGTQTGFINQQQALVLVSRMRRGRIWSDGAHHTQGVRYSQQLIIDQHPAPLRLILHRR